LDEYADGDALLVLGECVAARNPERARAVAEDLLDGVVAQLQRIPTGER
ncbi:MAG: hypothetical protein ICV72_09980, partial [Aldersonia sp.]|nr:hypothetical protein [Aldersonia sp.]